MKVKILSKKGEKLSFLLEDSTPAFANALRRVIMTEVPVLAVEWVDIHDNNSILFDEMIASRLGLIPLKFDPSKFSKPDECKCGGKGCPLCQVVLALEKTGPGTAYSGDLKSSNKDVKPTSPAFPIVDLLKNQGVRLEAIARLGTGKQHAKFQAANAAYQYYPEAITHDIEKAKKALKPCPADVMEAKGTKVTINDPARYETCMRYADLSEGGFEIKCDPTRFIFNVESISGLDPGYIVTKAAEILEGKAEGFMKELSKV